MNYGIIVLGKTDYFICSYANKFSQCFYDMIGGNNEYTVTTYTKGKC